MKGTCNYCNKEFTKVGILRHIKSCAEVKKSVDENKEGLINEFIVSISSKENPKEDWMYVAIKKDTELKSLQEFLLEAKSYKKLSSFKISGQEYIENLQVKFEEVLSVKGKIDLKFEEGISLEAKVVEEMLLANNKNIDIMASTYDIVGTNETLEQSLDQFTNDLVQDTRKENRKWSSIDINFDLDYHLEKLTKDELLAVASNFQIDKVISLKKQDLKDKIIDSYSEKASSFLENMDMERFNHLMTLIEKDGHEYIDELNMQPYVFTYFRDRGFIFTGSVEDKHIAIMPKEAKEVILKNNNQCLVDRLKRNEELIKLFWGMCYYYGALSLENFKVLVKNYVDYDVENIDLETILKQASIYYAEFHFDGKVGSDVIVDNVEYILSEQNKRGNIPYYIFDKEELFKVAKINYDGKNEAYTELHSYLTNKFGKNDDMYNALIFQLEDGIKNNKEFYDVVTNFLCNFTLSTKEEVNLVANEVYKFANSTRQWIIKGYCSREFVNLNRTVVKDEKVGRNDPCPCGSGKKYKKCCGKN